MKEFNLQEAKAGKPVCTRSGKNARILCFDAKGTRPIIALVEKDACETSCSFEPNGRFFRSCDRKDGLDLMMKGEKHEGWINIYRYKGDIRYPGTLVYKTKEDALNKRDTDYISTVEIEWEE